MHRMTCRNGFIVAAAMGLGLMVTPARAGTNNFLVEPASPTNPASAMWTLENIYNVLDTCTTNVTKRAGFAEPTGWPTNGTMHTLDDIMTLATNRAPAGKTGATNSYAIGDDGTNRIGVAWPNPRFIVQTNTNCVRDNLTGLIWARNANLSGATTIWGTAVTNCNNLDYGGQTDWRLPNRQELYSLIDAGRVSPVLPTGHPFASVQNAGYWTSTTSAGFTGNAWFINLNLGTVDVNGKSVGSYYVWPVRGGQ